jgi:hypothetical protein
LTRLIGVVGEAFVREWCCGVVLAKVRGSPVCAARP